MDCEQVKDQLDAHLLGALDDLESKEIKQHIESCRSCQKSLEEAIKAMNTLRSLPGIEPQRNYLDPIMSKQRGHRNSLLFLLISTLLLIFLGLYLLWILAQYRYIYPRYHLNLLQEEIHRYHLIHKKFPPQEGHTLKNSLFDYPDGRYIQKQFATNDRGEILDPWGTPYQYRYPGNYNQLSFDLYSCGPNKRDEGGKGDDIKNWKEP